MAKQLEDLKSSARTSTILQSVLGAIGGGLSNPYGGRFALGQAALGALGGYQKGSAGEEELNRSAFNILKGYSDAPAEEQAKAADELLALRKASMEEATKERIANLRGRSGLSYEEWLARETAKRELGPTQYQQIQQDILRNQQREANVNKAETLYQRWLSSQDAIGKTPQQKLEYQQKLYDMHNVGDALRMEGTGLGGGTLGSQRASAASPIFITKPK